jgi:CheY-like chemotaxis protein
MRRFLFVDDNRAYAENLAEIVREAGHAAEVTHSGREALQRVAAAGPPFDALVTDMRMPEMDGAALIAAVRAIDPLLPTVVVSAFADDDRAEAARRAGARALVAKGAPLSELLAQLEAAQRRSG